MVVALVLVLVHLYGMSYSMLHHHQDEAQGDEGERRMLAKLAAAQNGENHHSK